MFHPGKEGKKQKNKFNKEIVSKAKDIERKKAKDEKLRQKEAKETKRKQKLKNKRLSQNKPTLDDFQASPDDPIPCFLRKTIKFIEEKGLGTEGVYRVPGNRAQVDLLFQSFDGDPKVNIDDLNISVNAVATAVKDFFFKRLPHILEEDQMIEFQIICCKFTLPMISSVISN